MTEINYNDITETNIADVIYHEVVPHHRIEYRFK